MSTIATRGRQPAFWVPGDWNAFFGFGTNILVNLLVLTGLLRFVLKMPDDIVFGRILPATGLMLCLSTVYYAYLAYQLAKKTGRSDVCALPSGISVPHMFVVVFVIMLPILGRTNDPVKAWEAGLTWVFIQSFVLMAGGFVAPFIRRITPRAALLGSLAGIAITFISMRPRLADVYDARHRPRLLWHHPLELVRGRALFQRHSGRPRRHWRRNGHRLGLEPRRAQLWRSDPLGAFRLACPLRLFRAAPGHRPCVLGLRIPRHHPGDGDSLRHLRPRRSDGQCRERLGRRRFLPDDARADGGWRHQPYRLLHGQPFINAVYIGHPGWKSMGGRIGYSAATGLFVLVITWFGIVAFMTALIPVVAILPILLYIGMLIGSQAFQETPHRHAPAVVLALVPQIAAWGKTVIDGALTAAGTSAAAVGSAKLAATGVLYDGLTVLGDGATLAGIIIGSVAVFIIEREFHKAAAFALAGAVLTFLGLMHAEAIGFARSPTVAASYLIVAAMLFLCSKYAEVSAAEEAEPIGVAAEAA